MVGINLDITAEGRREEKKRGEEICLVIYHCIVN